MEQRPAEAYIQACRQRGDADWAHAPLTFKLYRDCARIPLSEETIAALVAEQTATQPSSALGLLLHDIYGVIRLVYQSTSLQASSQQHWSTVGNFAPPHLGRTVASGGARYPCELYVLVNAGQEVAAGLYHYDPLHHTLDFLRAGNFVEALSGMLAQPPEKHPAYTLFFSTLFWKDAFKYQEFSYRLQGLDVGCVLAQAQIVTAHHGWQPLLHFRFLDDQIDQLLGLESLQESVYAIMTLQGNPEQTLAASACQQTPMELLPDTLEAYEPLSRWPLLAEVHHASRIKTRTALEVQTPLPALSWPASTSDLTIDLPPVAYTHLRAKVQMRRSSHSYEYRARPLTREHLALLLQASQRGYQGDLAGPASTLSHTLLYCIVNRVEDIPAGIYVYQSETHQIQQVSSGNPSRLFQAVQLDPDWDMSRVSLALIPVGNYSRGFSTYGDRWYRMQNMEAGMCVQRMYLAAAYSGLLCRSQLSFRDRPLDMLLHLPADMTSLIQVLLSPCSSDAREGIEKKLQVSW